MQTRLTVPLLREERAALAQLAEQQRRDPRDQAAWLIRQSLVNLGLLPSAKPQTGGVNNERGQ